MGEYEIPLVIFTVLSQWAVGIALAIAILEWLKPKFMNAIGKEVLRIPVIAALAISIIGTVASLLHLNNPFKSYTSLIGTAHSWLSREIIAVILFNICLVALCYFWWRKSGSTYLRKGLASLTAVIGILMVISSATVYYSMELHPAWNNWTTYAQFLLTGILLGALTVSYFVVKAKQDEEKGNPVKVLGVYLVIIIVALFLTIGSSFIISATALESQIAASISYTSILFWIRILGSLLIPITLIIYFIDGKKSLPVNYFLLSTGFVLVGELSGRAMFYYSVMSQYPWF